MNTVVKFQVRLLDRPFEVTVYFSQFEFSVHMGEGGLVADGWFTYAGSSAKKDMDRVAFNARPEVSLFEDILKAKVVSAMKTGKDAWGAMVKYQHEKAWR